MAFDIRFASLSRLSNFRSSRLCAVCGLRFHLAGRTLGKHARRPDDAKEQTIMRVPEGCISIKEMETKLRILRKLRAGLHGARLYDRSFRRVVPERRRIA